MIAALKQRPFRHYALASIVVVVLAAAVLLAMGRVPICTCGYVKLWHGVVASSENSQHVTDWYTFTHIIHGFGFYLLFWLLGRGAGWPIGLRLFLAVTLESGWEILENTPLRFFLASRLPVRVVVVLALVMELAVAYWIRDNLTLNIIQLIHPVDAINRWQQR